LKKQENRFNVHKCNVETGRLLDVKQDDLVQLNKK